MPQKNNKIKRGSQESLSNSKISNFIQVRIEKMAIGGAAIARHEGVVIFVQGGVPGDFLEIEITFRKKNYLEARIVKIIEPSKARRAPPCPVAGACGGCSWQQLDEFEQLKQKQLIVSDNFKKFLPTLPVDILQIIPSPKNFRYRNRIQPKIKNSKFGFFGHGSHDLIETLDCLITEEKLAEKMPEIAAEATLKQKDARLEMYIDQDTQQVRWLFLNEEDDGVGFSQVNRWQNEQLVNTTLDWAVGKYAEVWDFYAGSGNFSFPLAEKFIELDVHAVELSSKLVERGRKLANSKKMHFHQADVESFLKRKVPHEGSLILIDPPRAGCTQAVMESLALSKPKKLLYISCHPTSLVRDLQWFFKFTELNNLKYRISRVQPFDMFPQTDHVETLVEVVIDS